MNLRAWFDPKVSDDPRRWIIDREVLGTWRLHLSEEIPAKHLYVHHEELRLADGSSFQVSAMCDWTFDEPQTTLTVASGSAPLVIATAGGASGLSTTIATGKGGLLALQICFDRDEQKGRTA